MDFICTIAAETETLSKYVRQLTECNYSNAKVFKFGFLRNRCHRLEGVLDDSFPIFAVPDSGAERNVMDADEVNSWQVAVVL